jgi:hypothetical protein
MWINSMQTPIQKSVTIVGSANSFFQADHLVDKAGTVKR